MTTRWRILWLLALAELLIMGLWFSATAVVPQLAGELALDDGRKAWLTMSVQIGFVAGALLSAVLNLADRSRAERLIAVSALVGAGCNALLAVRRGGGHPAVAAGDSHGQRAGGGGRSDRGLSHPFGPGPAGAKPLCLAQIIHEASRPAGDPVR